MMTVWTTYVLSADDEANHDRGRPSIPGTRTTL